MGETGSAYVIVVWMAVWLIAFPCFAPHRSILMIFFSGMLFLPEVNNGVLGVGPIKFAKYQTIIFTSIWSVMLYDSTNLFRSRPRKCDVPMLAFILWTFLSILMNDPPPDGSPAVRDALSQSLGTAVAWGLPYLIGRVYFSRANTLRELAVAFVFAGCVYAPLCVWESRMSPQLHFKLYGFTQHEFVQSIRYGGYRPMVFMPHGLAVGLVMSVAAFMSVWLYRTIRLSGYCALVLVPVAILIKSTGALILFAIGTVFIFLSRTFGTRVFLYVLIGTMPFYAVGRSSGYWTGRELVEWSAGALNNDRAQSVEFRLDNEDMLIRRALERPVTGWGGWGRARVHDENGRDLSVTDGFWILVLGDRGIVGLFLFTYVALYPSLRFAYRISPRDWSQPTWAPTAALAFILTFWMIDNIFNAMYIPIFMVVAGGITQWDEASFEPPSRHEADEVRRYF